MQILRTIAIAIILLSGASFDSFSQSRRNPSENAVASQKAAATDQRGTEKSPLIVKTIPSEKGHEEAAAEQAEKEDKSRSDWWLVKLTGVLAFFAAIQCIIFSWQGVQLKRTVDATREIGTAALALELPIIHSSHMGPEVIDTQEPIPEDGAWGGVVNDGPITRFSGIGDVKFRNYGRTPAFPVKIAIGSKVATKLPSEPRYDRIISCADRGPIKANKALTLYLNYGFEVNDAERASIASNTNTLWLYLLLEYRDAMGRTHESGACWEHGKQSVEDSILYFFDGGNAPPSYTRKT
jgi:hypothetical protein